MFAGIAEFKRSLIAARTEVGRRAVPAHGAPFGRPPKLRLDQRTLGCQLIEEEKSVSEVSWAGAHGHTLPSQSSALISEPFEHRIESTLKKRFQKREKANGIAAVETEVVPVGVFPDPVSNGRVGNFPNPDFGPAHQQ